MGVTPILRNRPARLMWSGQVASVTGDRLYQVALVWVTLRLSGSPAAVALVSLAETLPFLATSLASGALPARLDGLRVARAVDIGRAFLVAVIPVAYLTGHLSVMLLAVVAAGLSGLEAFFLPALQASLPRLVDREMLTPMVSALDSTDRLGRVLGAGGIGLIVLVVPEIHLFTLDAVTFVISAALLTPLLRSAAPIAPTDPAAVETRTSRIAAGWREIWQRPVLRRAAALRCICNLAWPAFTVGAPFIVAQRYHYGIGGYGLVLGAFGAGNLVGNLLTARICVRTLLRWSSIAWALAGLGFVALAVAPNYPLFALAAVAVGVCTPLANVTIDAYIAQALPQHVLARTYAAQRSLVVAAGAAGLPAAAYLIAHGSTTTALTLAGSLMIVAAGGTLLFQHRGRRTVVQVRASASARPRRTGRTPGSARGGG